MVIQPKKIYDLKQRTFSFAKDVIKYVDKLPRKVSGIEIGKQLIRAAGSVGANYIEADEALSGKDFIMRIKICKKEAKESQYWLQLSEPRTEEQRLKTHLVDESTQLVKIFASIIKNSNV
jgi:four helix bundle protein